MRLPPAEMDYWKDAWKESVVSLRLGFGEAELVKLNGHGNYNLWLQL